MRVVLQFLFCLRLWNSRVCNCLWDIPFSSWPHAKDQVLLAVGLARWSFRAAFHTHIAHGPLRNSKCSKTWNATLTLYKQSTISSKPEWRVKKLCKVCNVIQALCWLRKEENIHAKGWNKMKQSCLANSSEATSVFIHVYSISSSLWVYFRLLPHFYNFSIQLQIQDVLPKLLGLAELPQMQASPPWPRTPGSCFHPKALRPSSKPLRVITGIGRPHRRCQMFFLFFFEEAVEKKTSLGCHRNPATIGHFRPSGVRRVLVTQIGPRTGGTVTVTSKWSQRCWLCAVSFGLEWGQADWALGMMQGWDWWMAGDDDEARF